MVGVLLVRVPLAVSFFQSPKMGAFGRAANFENRIFFLVQKPFILMCLVHTIHTYSNDLLNDPNLQVLKSHFDPFRLSRELAKLVVPEPCTEYRLAGPGTEQLPPTAPLMEFVGDGAELTALVVPSMAGEFFCQVGPWKTTRPGGAETDVKKRKNI